MKITQTWRIIIRQQREIRKLRAALERIVAARNRGNAVAEGNEIAFAERILKK